MIPDGRDQDGRLQPSHPPPHRAGVSNDDSHAAQLDARNRDVFEHVASEKRASWVYLVEAGSVKAAQHPQGLRRRAKAQAFPQGWGGCRALSVGSFEDLELGSVPLSPVGAPAAQHGLWCDLVGGTSPEARRSDRLQQDRCQRAAPQARSELPSRRLRRTPRDRSGRCLRRRVSGRCRAGAPAWASPPASIAARPARKRRSYGRYRAMRSPGRPARSASQPPVV